MSMIEAGTDILHIGPIPREPEGQSPPRAGDVVRRMASAGLRMELCGDVYRGLARIMSGGRSNGRPVDDVGARPLTLECVKGGQDTRTSVNLGERGLQAVIVCLDGVWAEEMEFFTFVSRLRRELPVYVYVESGAETWITKAIELGATGVLAEEVIRALVKKSGADDADAWDRLDSGTSTTQGCETPDTRRCQGRARSSHQQDRTDSEFEISELKDPPGDGAVPGDRRSEYDGANTMGARPSTLEGVKGGQDSRTSAWPEEDSGEETSGPVRVPWLQYESGPVRQPPSGEAKGGSFERRGEGESGRDSESGIAGSEYEDANAMGASPLTLEGVKGEQDSRTSRFDDRRSPDPLPERERGLDEPLLTEAELAALMGDDVLEWEAADRMGSAAGESRTRASPPEHFPNSVSEATRREGALGDGV